MRTGARIAMLDFDYLTLVYAVLVLSNSVFDLTIFLLGLADRDGHAILEV